MELGNSPRLKTPLNPPLRHRTTWPLGDLYDLKRNELLEVLDALDDDADEDYSADAKETDLMETSKENLNLNRMKIKILRNIEELSKGNSAENMDYEGSLEPYLEEKRAENGVRPAVLRARGDPRRGKRYRLGLYDCIASHCGESSGSARGSCIVNHCHQTAFN